MLKIGNRQEYLNYECLSIDRRYASKNLEAAKWPYPMEWKVLRCSIQERYLKRPYPIDGSRRSPTSHNRTAIGTRK